MVLNKQYLRYKFISAFNIIAATKCNVIFVDLNDYFVACSAIANIYVWDLRKGEKVAILPGNGSLVTVIARSVDSKFLAAGYENGSVTIFDLKLKKNIVMLHGHVSPVSFVVYDNTGLRIASGSKDTDIIIWDAVSECGLFRLKGHKDVVTCCRFLQSRNVLISSSKDTFLKFWDLDTQHCFQTISVSHCAVWYFVVTNEEDQIITCSGHNNLCFWNIHYCNETIISCCKAGTIQCVANNPIKLVQIDRDGRYLACCGNSKLLEIYRFLSNEEKMMSASKGNANLENNTQRTPVSSILGDQSLLCSSAGETMKSIGILKASFKIKSFDFFVEKKDFAKFVILLSDSRLEVHNVQFGSFECDMQLKYVLKIPGHQTDVRTLCFSSDNAALLSGSAETLKIWNRGTQTCICTMECEYALCSLFVPGDRHCICGTKTGKLQIFFIPSGELLESVKSHEGAVWSLSLNSDQKFFVSGGADGLVKFWEFTLIDKEQSKNQRLSICHTRTLKLTEDVLSVKFSNDGRLLAVSLLDSTVKIFISPSLKFFLSLYGHKFPVLCMDIADDNNLIVTGSADRNIKIWGLDFGDCHKSIFAHDDSVMCLQFIPKTHMVFTGGKDGTIKQWDVDNFQRISTFKIHHGEVWALAVSSDGQHVVSSSHDKSICLLQKTNEILILDEEREFEREQDFMRNFTVNEDVIVASEKNPETALTSRKTGETLEAVDALLDALDIYKKEINLETLETKSNDREQSSNMCVVPQSMVTSKKSRLGQIKHVLKQTRLSEMKDVIPLLSFMDVIELMKIFIQLLKEKWNIEFICTCVFLMLRIHHGQVISYDDLLAVIDGLRQSSIASISNIKDIAGFNLAGLRVLIHDIKRQNEELVFMEPISRSVVGTKLKIKKNRTNKVLLSF